MLVTDDDELYCEGCDEHILDCECEEPETSFDHVFDVNRYGIESEFNKSSESEDIPTLVDKGIALDKIGKHAEASNLFVKALEVHKRYVLYPLYHKGLLLGELARYEEALDCFNKALEINPKDPDVLYAKACIVTMNHKKEEAIELIAQIINLKPEYKKSIKENNAFENLKGDPHFKELVN